MLVDTSPWVDHLRRGDPGLIELLEGSAVAMHSFVIGGIACGSLRDRDAVLELLQELPAVVVASEAEAERGISHLAPLFEGHMRDDVEVLVPEGRPGRSRMENARLGVVASTDAVQKLSGEREPLQEASDLPVGLQLPR